MFAGHIWLDSLSNLKAVQGARRVAATAMNLPVERTRINITMTAIRITIPSPPSQSSQSSHSAEFEGKPNHFSANCFAWMDFLRANGLKSLPLR